MASVSVHRYLCTRRAFSLCMSSHLTQHNKKMSTSSSEEEVILERNGNKGIIILNRPKALNALNLSMIKKIYPQLRTWEMDNTMKMVIIKANGEKAFCAGGDVRAIAETGKGSALGEEFFREEYRLNNLIGSLSIPFIALINGIFMGGGVGLSVHGPFRVVTEKAVFAMPETQIGFFPDVGGSHFLPRLPGKLGLFLALTGHRLTSRDIFKAGVATHFVPSVHLKDLEQEILRIESPDILSIDKILTKYQEKWEVDYKKEFTLKQFIGRMNSAFGDSQSVEQIIDNLNKDGSDWAKKQVETLRKMSPTSLKVTFEQLKRGHSLTLPECLKMEFRISQHFMERSDDFYSGVKALLIDKNSSPVWKPSKLEDVSDSEVQAYFAPLSGNRKELGL